MRLKDVCKRVDWKNEKKKKNKIFCREEGCLISSSYKRDTGDTEARIYTIALIQTQQQLQ